MTNDSMYFTIEFKGSNRAFSHDFFFNYRSSSLKLELSR